MEPRALPVQPMTTSSQICSTSVPSTTHHVKSTYITGNEAEETVAVVVEQLIQEIEETTDEADVAGSGVTRRELLTMRMRDDDHIMIGGEETEDEEEVSVQDIIQSPNHIGGVIDHEIGGDHLRHVLLVGPFLVEITLLLCINNRNRNYEIKTRREANLKHDHQRRKTEGSTLFVIFVHNSLRGHGT